MLNFLMTACVSSRRTSIRLTEVWPVAPVEQQRLKNLKGFVFLGFFNSINIIILSLITRHDFVT